MIIDAPGVEDTDPKDKEATIALTDDNADQIMNMINRINRQ